MLSNISIRDDSNICLRSWDIPSLFYMGKTVTTFERDSTLFRLTNGLLKVGWVNLTVATINSILMTHHIGHSEHNTTFATNAASSSNKSKLVAKQNSAGRWN